MASDLEPVDPAEPLAPWFGGKRNLAKQIIARIEAIPHRCYAEPFVGMGGVILRRASRPANEVVNDINGDIVNLFRVVREHPDELANQFRWEVSSREVFRRLVDTPADTLTDVQRAARFLYMQRLSFGAVPATMVTKGQIGLGPQYKAKVSPGQIRRLVEAAHRRLERVHIECLDWARFIERYDRPFTLFYVDPPYWGHERDYGRGIFDRGDFARMAEILGGLKGRFVLSLNDRPEVRDVFAEFDIEPVTTSYSANAKAARKAAELLISN
ncbi:MAG: DNA adenine methylase [Gammaproteobacteria bacterium]|nr:DNA adenine methylase [Gammaproteobacteria bacterium]